MTEHFTSTDPAEILATVPKSPTREQTLKTVQDKMPGHIAIASDRASFAGCRLVTFCDGAVDGLQAADAALFKSQCAEAGFRMVNRVEDPFGDRKDYEPEARAEELANLYFSTRANLLVVDKAVTEVGITMWITTQLDEDDLAEMNEVNTRVQIEMREWRERREKDKADAAAEVAEQRRLAEVGKNAETYNLAGRLKEAEKEIAALKKAAS